MTGIIGGLLATKVERKCLRCGALMIELPEIWKLDEVQRGGIDHDGRGQSFIKSGRIFTVGISTCKTCGYIELLDRDL